MSAVLLLPFNQPGTVFDGLRSATGLPDLDLAQRRFPDGESYLRVDGDVAGRRVVVVARLCPADPELFSLLALADTLRDLGAGEVRLLAPYLPYMRQDTRFRPGEAVTSRTFARLVSDHFDALMTVDPHLHRYVTLNQIYTIPSAICRAASAIARWIGEQVDKPLLIGPDEESEQWVAAVAEPVPAPFTVLRKTRHGDRDVDIELAGLDDRRLDEGGHTPVLVDDIISSGMTMAETVAKLARRFDAAPVCIGTHGVFAAGALDALRDAGAGRIVTCNTLPHDSNAIDLAPLLVQSLEREGWFAPD